MTHQNDCTFAPELAEKGLEAVPELLRVLINNVMQVERSKYLQAEEYERTEDRKGHANGFKPKTVKTRMGEITFAVPQVREGGFYPSALEKGLRSERALVTTLAEMYVQGVSTRKVKAITEQLCGIEISAMLVSRAAAQLDEVLQQWRERPLFGSDNLPPQTSALVKRAVAYLHQNYTRPLTRWEIAAAVGVSEDYLTRVFNRELEISPWDYLNRYRILQAKALLRSTSRSITEIAHQVGFKDQAYFSRVFSRITGMTAVEYRNKSGNRQV
ncbi:MAG TPA: transposase [Bellilinea sp.]|nr:transposase [Bellilinea sp.]